MVTQLHMHNLFEQDVIKIVSVCPQYRESVSNSVIPDTVACFPEYNFVTLKQQAEKQYSTHYLPEKYKQH